MDHPSMQTVPSSTGTLPGRPDRETTGCTRARRTHTYIRQMYESRDDPHCSSRNGWVYLYALIPLEVCEARLCKFFLRRIDHLVELELLSIGSLAVRQ
mmetsp:Transcript_30304/g.68463  ORF Transcript_30304/g.68463 Transcript_30304/m.68463 type:complete len:98 (-) Transcript_30304:427-720(-)